MKLPLAIRIFLIVAVVTVILGVLSRSGTNVDSADAKGYTLLHAAARDGDAGVARMLLGMDADVNALNEDGETPLDVAERTGHGEVAEILRAAGGTNGG
jgi:ankyrin repeat protein